ncbi:MAG: DNA polymerase III subunit delta [Candidatus Nitrohelix vancouverensis]|uniref:DNA polymerase III subunit delta n=1 Tax=Candidatus Nitrohelix vancouverensis TaxID=2705534 RepID=A0A7T0G2V5_9BACT|nr:MAG: DNA polymerase III subunit delta [Candidatus Nitrohelix vancouverensis]
MPLSAGQFLQQIQQGQWSGFHFLYGEERFFHSEIINALLNQIVAPDDRDFNFEIFDAKESGPNAWIAAARTLSFMGGDKFIVVRNLHERTLEADEADSLMAYADKPAEGSCMVVTADKIDRKRKLYKTLAKRKDAVECGPPDEGSLVSWLKLRAQEHGYTLAGGAAKLIVGRVGAKSGALAMELEKLMTFAGTNKTIKEQDAASLVGDVHVEDGFALTDALKEKNTEKALRILDNQLSHGEEPIRMLGLITWQLRTIWEVKSHADKRLSPQQIAKAIGANPFVVQKALPAANRYSVEELKQCFRELSQTDRELKSTSKSPEGALRTLIWNLCATSARKR